jgi:hypothetical protein
MLVSGITTTSKRTAQYQNFLPAIRPDLHREDLQVTRPVETWSVDDENESDVKCNDEARQGLLTGNQYDVDPLFERKLFTDRAPCNISSRPERSCSLCAFVIKSN